MRLNFKPLANPILIVSDAPELLGGLSRFGRDLASLICTMPEFRCAYLGRGGFGRRQFPWCSYHYPESGQWGEDYLAQVWNDFAGKDDGIVMSLWDASRMLWFGQPHNLQTSRPALAQFLGSGRRFAKWGYFPVDGTGPDETMLPSEPRAATAGYDRVCAASEWGKVVLANGGRPDADWIPHGIWPDKFHPTGWEWDRNLPQGRKVLGWDKHAVVVGVNMANQARKDWPVAFEAAQILRANHGSRFKFWVHTDRMMGYWNIYALAADYGLNDCTEASVELTDEQMALRYSACDVTMLPSGGEGFGFPIAESMACGIGCVVSDYAAGQEIVPEDMRVPPVTYKIDTQHNVRRAVLSGWGFASRAQQQIERHKEDPIGQRERMLGQVEHLDWNRLKYVWEKWLRRGIGLDA